ncbi:hypothetical protein B296_00055824 [Ensete ventricosum]|uniref:Uncharacterized protein n=1 Tax=Ensete ventricosum TaxID=4639 RepID=A0A426XXH9_ENSVE|nr:hypothetical protein B296_00055824 [Ensete ventricosum]
MDEETSWDSPCLTPEKKKRVASCSQHGEDAGCQVAQRCSTDPTHSSEAAVATSRGLEGAAACCSTLQAEAIRAASAPRSRAKVQPLDLFAVSIYLPEKEKRGATVLRGADASLGDSVYHRI